MLCIHKSRDYFYRLIKKLEKIGKIFNLDLISPRTSSQKKPHEKILNGCLENNTVGDKDVR